MFTCSLCHFITELDDVVARRPFGHCLCLRCWSRRMGEARPMPRFLCHEISDVLARLDPAETNDRPS